MADKNYPSNSHAGQTVKSEASRKPVVSDVRRKKKGGFGKFLDLFVIGDIEETVTDAIQNNILPNIKRTIWEAIGSIIGVDIRPSGSPSKVSWRNNGYYDYTSNGNRNNRQPQQSQEKPNSIFDYDMLIYRTRGDAIAVLNAMQDSVAEYGCVSVSEMFDLSGETCSWTGQKYGWTSLEGAYTEGCSGGYRIRLPKPMPL